MSTSALRIATTLGHRVRQSGMLASALVGGVLALPRAAQAQWSTTYETFYAQAPHNWVFRDNYQAADRLFNAFDYGHAILYETLWNEPNAPASVLEEKEYNFLTKTVLVRPPRVPLEEAAIEVNYAKLAPEAKVMFDWAHILHRQIYDVLADERLSQEQKDAEVQRLIAYYKTRRDLAFSSNPKSMELMQEQPYSLAFRKEYPKFNGLIWGYHWLQVGLYEPLMVGKTSDERQAGVRATTARFWQMLQDPPTTLPYQMPMTAAVAPTFSARYPEAAIIFDNLHSMHDVISDILANDSVPRSAKRAEIMRAARLYRDDTSYVMPVAAWRTMARAMGIENMGGPAVNFLPALPTPTVTRGAVMEHDEQTGQMLGIKYGQMTGAHGGHDMAGMSMPGGNMAGMNMSGQDSTRAGADSTAGMSGMRHGNMPGMRGTSNSSSDMMAMHMRMMQDPVIRRRMMADPEMRRMMTEMMNDMPADHRAMMQQMMRGEAAAPPARAGSRSRPSSGTRRPTATSPATKRPASDAHVGHDGMAMPGMNMPRTNEPPAKPVAPKGASRPATKRPAAKQPAKQPTRQQPARDSVPSMDHSKMPGMKTPQ